MTRRFPGVDPYLEDPAFWRDFRRSFIVYCSDAMNQLVPDSYDVRINLRSLRPHSIGNENRPLAVLDEERVSYLEIFHRPSQQLVTIMELLSPSNKVDPGHREYMTKRNIILHEPVHLVEFDLLLGGKRLPMRRPLPPGDCYAIVSRCSTRPNAEVYSWSLREPLPAIRVPLRAPDPDLVLDLAAVYEETFRRGRYGRSLRYGQRLQVPLTPEATEWIATRMGGADG